MIELQIENNEIIKCESDDNIISINDNVTCIKELAFSNLNARKIILPDTIETIEDFAFEGCHFLEEIFIPKNVNFIGIGILSDCPNLKKIIVDQENINYTSLNGSNVIASIEESFSDGEKFITVIAGCQNSKIPEGTNSISYRAFYKQHYLESLELPSSLEMISEEAFYDCNNLKKISIPTKTKSISIDSFIHCSSLEHVNIEPNNKNYTDGGVDAIIDKNNNTLILASLNTKNFNVARIGYFAFAGLNIEEVEIPEGIEETPSGLFDKCNHLKYVSLPSTLKSIILPFDKQKDVVIHYNGTLAEWKNVNSRCITYDCKIDYDVICLDGIAKFNK